MWRHTLERISKKVHLSKVHPFDPTIWKKKRETSTQVHLYSKAMNNKTTILPSQNRRKRSSIEFETDLSSRRFVSSEIHLSRQVYLIIADKHSSVDDSINTGRWHGPVATTSSIGDRFISRGANAAAVFPLSNDLSTGHGVNVFVKRRAAAPRWQRVAQWNNIAQG